MYRILANRISDLEEAVQSGRVAAFPSQLLLEGYASSEVDRDTSHILSPEQPDDSGSEGDRISSMHIDTERELATCSKNGELVKSKEWYSELKSRFNA
jgi:hypothetical protein